MISGKRLMAAAFALSTVVVLGATACSNAGRTADPTPVTTWWITPSALGAATKPAGAPTVAPSATPTGAAAAVGTAVGTAAATSAATPAGTAAATTTTGGGYKIVLIAINLTFDKTTLTAPAGKVSFELDNKDAGQPHNIHVFKGTDVSGESIDSSALNVGPTTDYLDVTLAKGAYFFQCDVHPTTMFGTLTVN